MKRHSILLFVVIMLFALTASAVAEEQKWDLGGRVIRIQTRWRDVTPLGARGDYNWFEPDARLQAHVKAVEEMFNCKIEFVMPGSHLAAAEELRRAVLAGDQPFDFSHITESLPELAIDGLIQPLDDVLGPDFYDDFPPMFRRYGTENGATVAGKTYGFEALNYSAESRYLFWNKSLFEREGLESLYDIYARGEWTWDKFAEMAYALTKDTDGDGVYDQFGVCANSFRDEIIDMLVSNGARLTKVDENGKVVWDLLAPEVIETMDFMQKLWADGVWTDGIEKTQAGMIFVIGTSIIDPVYQEGPDEWGIIPPPQGPHSKGEINGFSRWVGYIPVYVENPREVIEVVSALWQTKQPYIGDFETWEEQYWSRFLWAVHDEESYNFLKDPGLEPVLVPSQIEFLIALGKASPNWNQVFGQIVKEGASPTSTLAAWEPVLQGILDEMLGQ
ncbi:MAG TPA: extracellular solute-binding protein [Firmicutes bacterium]|nr:extracellular solute-binding protein [Bacillota bacterium]